MDIQHQVVAGPVDLVIDVVGGRYRIATQSLNEILVDARQTHNKSLVPRLDVNCNAARLVKHPLLRWFTTARGVDATVLVPEGSSINVKMYNGLVAITGHYRTIDVRLRNGEVVVSGPGFALDQNGLVKITSGNLRCINLSEAGFEMPLIPTKIKSIDHPSGSSLRVEVYLGELDFS
jgi:hypothetical protein